MYVQFFIICLKRWCSIVEKWYVVFSKTLFQISQNCYSFFFLIIEIYFSQNEAKEEQKRCNSYIYIKQKQNKTFFTIYWILLKKGFGQVTNQVLFAHDIHFKIFKPIAWMFLILIYTGIVIWWYHFFEQVKQLFKLPFLKKKLYRLF